MTRGDHVDFELAAYALDALGDDERRVVDDHLAATRGAPRGGASASSLW